jgi:Protein of unknown function (DUF2490)
MFSHAMAQRTSTFENWFSASAQKKVQNFTFTFEEGWRIREMYMSRQNYSDLNIEYKLNKNFSFSGGYRLALKPSMFNITEVNHRLYIDATGSYGLGNLELSLRTKFQYTSLGQEDDISLPSETYFRNRLKAKLKVNDMISVSGYYEMLLIMSPAYKLITENRPGIEAQFKLNKKNSISISYLLRNYIQVENPMNIHVMGLDYVFKF